MYLSIFFYCSMFQYLETYGLRTRQILTRFPRWVPKFLHLLTFDGTATRNSQDIVCIIVFWSFLIYGCLFASFTQIPACLATCVFSVSISYRVGFTPGPSSRSSMLYRRRRKPVVSIAQEKVIAFFSDDLRSIIDLILQATTPLSNPHKDSSASLEERSSDCETPTRSTSGTNSNADSLQWRLIMD